MPNPKHPDPHRFDPEETIETEETIEMTTTPAHQEGAEPYYEDDADGFDAGTEMPQRKRTRFLSPITAALLALILGGVGFYVGIRVEKANAGTSTGSLASLATAGGGTGKAASGGTRPTAGFSAAFGNTGGGATGTVSSIDGNTLYVKETSGDTVKVKLTGSTTIDKTESVSKNKIYPGDSITVEGSSKSGTVSATSITDSGASSSTSSSSASGSTSSSSSSSGVSSLFGS